MTTFFADNASELFITTGNYNIFQPNCGYESSF